MARLRLALAQLDACVGDLDGNARLVREAVREAADAGADLVVCPEMVLNGYPPEDLVLRPSFREASRRALDALAADLVADGLGEVPVLVGHLDAADDGLEPRALNAASLLVGGERLGTYVKHHLPTYGVFDEERYFRSGTELPVWRVRGVDVAAVVCEDLWVQGGPVEASRQAGVGLLVVLNGSPFEAGKAGRRQGLGRGAAQTVGAPVAYVNLVGGQDELVFDGGSFVVDADGHVVARAPRFEPTVLVHDVDVEPSHATSGREAEHLHGFDVRRHDVPGPGPRDVDAEPLDAGVVAKLDRLDEIWGALVVGTRDYVRKNGFGSVVLGLSGGIDSAVVATVAVDALGAADVHTVAMPSRYSSAHSRSDADDLAARQGTQHGTVPIGSLHDAFVEALRPVGGVEGLADENLQSRARGVVLMALSNQHGHLVLTTGNKSEIAVGYSTLYGDSAGGFGVIKDVYKTDVWALARRRNERAREAGDVEPVPEASITKPPSAELRPGQVDTDSLPGYDVLDAVLHGYVDRDLGRAGLLEAGHDPDVVERVIRLVDTAEYKRRQYPPGPKTSLKAFGRDRRLPVTNRWRERVPGGHDADVDASGPEV